MKHKNLTLIGILTAILCICSPFAFPLGAIPVTISILAVFLISCLSSPKQSIVAVIIYILLGATGIPVFSGFTGGIHQIAGITGGYILGYIPCSFTVSLLINKFENKKYIYPLSMIIGTAECYIIGTVWYSVQANMNFFDALTVCVLPFIFGDIIKIAVASIIGYTLRKRLSKYL